MGSVARPNRQPQRRKEILDAAIGLIERHDLASLRVTDVAAELLTSSSAV
jgi:AcrR family transcriptional regulator